MYGFKGTKCKIESCGNPVWPNKTLGYCNRHYQRYKRGRMNKDGTLSPLPIKTKICEDCGIEFILKEKARNVKWCELCRPEQYKNTQTDNNRGIFRRSQKSNKKLKERYVKFVLNRFIKLCEKRAKYRSLLDMRKEGKTYREIGEIYGVTYQAIWQRLRLI